MSLYHITGISGAGKSTILARLRQSGYEAYDVDEAGPATAKWTHITTGYVHPKSSVKAADRTPDFLANHSWKVPYHEVAELAKQATHKTIFLGGGIDNDAELKDLFNTIFALVIDDETLKHRLAIRTNNDWGKSTHELAQSLAWNHDLDKKYEKLGYVVINASQPSNIVMTEILSYIHDDSKLA